MNLTKALTAAIITLTAVASQAQDYKLTPDRVAYCAGVTDFATSVWGKPDFVKAYRAFGELNSKNIRSKALAKDRAEAIEDLANENMSKFDRNKGIETASICVASARANGLMR